MNSEDLPYNLDEFLADPDFLIHGSVDFFLPSTCDPSSTSSSSLMVSDLSSISYPSNNVFNLSSCDEIQNRPQLPPLSPRPQPQLPPLSPRSQPQPGLDLIKFKHDPLDISKNKRVLTSCISTQAQSSKHYKQDCGDHHGRHHQDQQPLTPREIHNVSQRRRRDRVKEKMKTLKDLIPNCHNKNDMASVLDEAVKYVQLLKFQTQFCGGYQQQLQAVQQAAWGATQIPIMSPAASSSVRASSYLHYPLQQQMQQYPMIMTQPTSLPSIPATHIK